jgi:hypothetical protein
MTCVKHGVVATASAGVLALSAFAGSARAVTIPPTTVLDPVTVNGAVEISLADYAVALTAPGTKYLNPPIFIPDGDGVATAACTAAGYCDYGTGVISATLGGNPSVKLGATPANNGGGDSSLFMSYQVEYVGTPGDTVGAVVHVNDTIDQFGDSAAIAEMTVSGINGTVYSAYDCSASPEAAFGCGTAPSATFTDQAVTLYDNTVYTVDLSLQIYAHDPVLAAIDPTFTTPAGAGGYFIFSPGITSGVPEPATWAAMLIGFGGVGAAMRRARRERWSVAAA